MTPGQKVQVTLSGLPADYDLVVFKDIDAAFVKQLVPDGPAALTRLSAEFAPSTFSSVDVQPVDVQPVDVQPRRVLAVDVQPVDVQPVDVLAVDVQPVDVQPVDVLPFDVLAVDVLSPSTFSPSTFSPSTFSPSTFSPSTRLQSAIRHEVAQAFSSAQTRSIIGVSATPGNGQRVGRRQHLEQHRRLLRPRFRRAAARSRRTASSR